MVAVVILLILVAAIVALRYKLTRPPDREYSPDPKFDPIEASQRGIEQSLSRQERRRLERDAEWSFHTSKSGAPLKDARTKQFVTRQERRENAKRRLEARREQVGR